MKIGAASFRGEAPRITPRALPENGAQEATNCRLQSGDLEPWRQFSNTKALSNIIPVQTIYRLGPAATPKWMSWNAQVDVARGLIPGDATYRTYLTSPSYFTTPTFFHQGARFTTFALAVDGNEPATRPLGVPEPTIAPVATPGVDPTPTNFSVNIPIDPSTDLSSWTVSTNNSAANYASVVVVDAAGGNPLPSYGHAVENNAGSVAFQYKNFGTKTSAAGIYTADWAMQSAASNSGVVAVFAVANDENGAGARIAISGNKGSDWTLLIMMGTAWATAATEINRVVLTGAPTNTVNNPGPPPTFARMVVTWLVNADNSVKITAEVFDGVTSKGSLSATGSFGIGDFSGFTTWTGNDGKTTYYDNLQIQASGSTGYTPINTATSYVYTFVNDLGEESAPSPASNTVLRPDGVAVTLTALAVAAPGDPAYGVLNKRLYRAVTGATGSVFLLVAEITLATATYLDDKDDSQIGPDILETEDWDLPPALLEGIIALPNGIMAGFFRNQLCLSAKGHPHAWPVIFRLTTDSDIVAIANIDNTIVIGTNTFVYVATGNDPATYSMSKPGEPQACVAKRSMLYLDQIGVVFASPDGYMLCAGSAGQVGNLTEQVFTKRQWQALTPESIIAAVHDGCLHFFFTGTTPDAGYALDPKPTGFGLVRLSYHATAVHAEPLTDGLYLVLDRDDEPTATNLPAASTAPTPNGLTIYQFDAGGSDMVFRWKGRLNLMPHPTTLTIAQVRAEAYTNLLARVYADGTVLKEKVIQNSREYGIPALDTYETYEIELMGTSRVRGMQAAEDVMELT